ncbi:MAG TPA: hypothetical protein DEW46_05505 [Verrucomicrobia bacterium]|nr:hypothetical protein [Verrucomicrobiota bacterium]
MRNGVPQPYDCGADTPIGRIGRIGRIGNHSLEVTPEGVRFPNRAFPPGSGWPPAEGAEGAVGFSICLWGRVGFMLRPYLFWGNYRYTVSAEKDSC